MLKNCPDIHFKSVFHSQESAKTIPFPPKRKHWDLQIYSIAAAKRRDQCHKSNRTSNKLALRIPTREYKITDLSADRAFLSQIK
jgi:hypothetical protein